MAVYLHLKNLSGLAGIVDVRRFFTHYDIPEHGVHILEGPDRDAFIMFKHDCDLLKAISLSGQHLLGQPVTLHIISSQEMEQIIERRKVNTLKSTPMTSTSGANQYTKQDDTSGANQYTKEDEYDTPYLNPYFEHEVMSNQDYNGDSKQEKLGKDTHDRNEAMDSDDYYLQNLGQHPWRDTGSDHRHVMCEMPKDRSDSGQYCMANIDPLTQKIHVDPLALSLRKSVLFSDLVERANAKPGNSKFLCFIRVNNMAGNATSWGLWEQYGGVSGNCKGVVVVKRRDAHNAWCAMFAYIAFDDHSHRTAAIKAGGVKSIRKWTARATFSKLAQVEAHCKIIECTTPGKDHELSKSERALLSQFLIEEQNKESNAVTHENALSIFSRLTLEAESPDAKPLSFILVSSDAMPEGATASGMCRWLSGPNAASIGAIMVRTPVGDAVCAYIAFERRSSCKAALEGCEGGWMRSEGNTRRAIVRYGSEYDVFESTEMGNDIKVSEERWKELQQVTPLEVEQNQAQRKKRKAEDTNLEEKIDKKIKVHEKVLLTEMPDSVNYSSPVYVKIHNLSLSIKFHELRSFFQEFTLISDRNGIILKVGQHSSTAYVKFNSIPDGLKIDSLDCSMLKGEGVAIEMITSDIFRHEQSNSIEGAKTQPQTDLTQNVHAGPSALSLSKSVIFSDLVECANAKPGNSKFLCFIRVSKMAANATPWRLWKQYSDARGNCKGVVVVQRRDAHNAWCTMFAYIAFEDHSHRTAAIKAAGVKNIRKWNARATFSKLAQVEAHCKIIECTRPGKDRELSNSERALLSQFLIEEQNKESNVEIIKESGNCSNAVTCENASDQPSIFSRLILDAELPDAKPLSFIHLSSDAIPEGATASGMCRWLSVPNATSTGSILVRTPVGDAVCAYIAFESRANCKVALEGCEGGWIRSEGGTRRGIVRYGSEYDVFESTEMGNDIKVSEERWKELQQVTPLEVEQNQAQRKKRKAEDTNLEEKINQKIKMHEKVLHTEMPDSVNYPSPGYVKIHNLSLSVRFHELRSFFQEFSLISERNGIILKAGQHSSTAYVKFSSLPDGHKIDSLDCSMLKGEGVAIEMITSDIFEHEQSNSIDRAETQPQTDFAQNIHAGPSALSLNKSVIFSDLVECANAKPGNSKFLCFIRVSKMAASATPWRLWKQYGDAGGNCKGVVVVQRRDAHNAWCTMFAYIAFEDHSHRTAAIKAAGVKSIRKWNARATFSKLAQVEAHCKIIECTTPGKDRELSNSERALLSQFLIEEQNKESNAEIII